MLWRTLQLWNGFENDCLAYFNTVFSAADRTALVIASNGLQTLFATVNAQEVRTKEDVKAYLLTLLWRCARGKNNARLPSDSHASDLGGGCR